MVTNLLIASAMLFTSDTACPVFNPIDEPVGQFEESAKALAKTVSVDSNQAEKLSLIKHYLALGDYKAGLELIEPLLADTPNDQELQRYRNGFNLQRINNAGFLSKLGAAKKMRAGCEADLSADAENTNAALCLARFYGNAPGIAGGSKEKRDEYLNNLKSTDEAKYHFGRVTSGVEMTPDQRLEALTKSLELEDNPDVRFQLAFSYIQKEDWAQANAMLGSLATSQSDKPLGRIALYQTGRIATLSDGYHADGVSALRKFLSGPTWVAGQNLRSKAHGLIGSIYEQQGCVDEALAAHERALRYNRKNKEAKKAVKALKREIKKR